LAKAIRFPFLPNSQRFLDEKTITTRPWVLLSFAIPKETTVAQCLKAATIGKEAIKVANNYKRLDISQLNALVPKILSLASTFTGKDYTALKMRKFYQS
jgi:hypothetical protein